MEVGPATRDPRPAAAREGDDRRATTLVKGPTSELHHSIRLDLVTPGSPLERETNGRDHESELVRWY